MPTLSDLLTPRTAAQVLDLLLTNLKEKGLPVTDWNAGGVERTHLEVEAAVQADLWALVPQIAGSGFLFSPLCRGPWVDLLAEGFYNEQRYLAVFAVDTLRLTCAAGLGPYTIEPGDLWAATPDGKLYSNTAGGTLPAGGTLELTFRAESPGSAYNVPRNTITVLKTPLPGVSVTNIEGGLVTSGTDEENDDSVKERCRLKWASLALAAPADFYDYWARKADPTVRLVKVLTHPRGQGTVDVVVWGEGGIGIEVPDTVDALLKTKAPLTADVMAYAATERTLNLTGTVKVRAGYLSTARAEAAANLSALQKATKIGGTLVHAAVIEALMVPAGVVDAVIDTPGFSPSSPLVLDDLEALTLVDELDWLEV